MKPTGVLISAEKLLESATATAIATATATATARSNGSHPLDTCVDVVTFSERFLEY